ncbi:ATPase family associated with various cellular activities (AAA) [Acetitomaculum ruminis DSM 5522]|uniref:ATPase family associated with various cellular activities (AAA) n=1 Tax=Acetitomaculum ruminis DSM 5522 TaxID=1120918 RepID=A0A1I0Z6R0_9FIRM|nr:MoxR family ATPase [Acetitomaculum ruminis]SFB21082.1 ATPase family associated with various cellular activities (AAA) [Acetitomaculum ruminis DSM 5522]
MNIKKAKKQIKNTLIAYFTKDEKGNFLLPVEKQRPLFLMGPPGIGKTAIVSQVAKEMNVGFLAYSMTHHTRQSAIGLPYIEKKIYEGKEVSVSEYTMSEIIASIYEYMEKSKNKNGILFLDEINCVSETLAPLMLMFLQYKTFGKHKVPKGWVIVTAGNPPEYNDSVRQFDIATWDRLKRIDIEPDFESFREYGISMSLHSAIITFLDIKRTAFYKISNNGAKKSFVTARGWEDLSLIIKLYEKNEIEVDEDLVSQYLQDEEIANAFVNYYHLYNNYRCDYQIENILKNKVDKTVKERVKKATFDEKISLISLLFDTIKEKIKKHVLLYESSDISAFEESEKSGKELSDEISNAIDFCQNNFDGSKEALVLISRLSFDSVCATFIANYGCRSYFKYNDALIFE